ncbi:unnamed protein product [Oncorhynchus mykiss]|uniref:Uncharacterized protein n=1 Tax=Oncorhynchus mykiss TaxID=8022 RepID=A0A060WDH8_ONCMY|nr:unnamed protein product [Oncorhynchus mykiss]
MHAYLAGTVFLEQCDHSTVSMAVVKCLQDYNITNDDIMVFDTDNAAYMKKTYKAAPQSLFPISLHITCMVPIMNLVGIAFCKTFDQLNAFMLRFSQMFYQAGALKRRYLPSSPPNWQDGREHLWLPMSNTLELMVLSSAVPLTAVWPLQGVHRDGNRGVWPR